MQIRRLIQPGLIEPPKLTALELMIIALEDRRFFSHSGVDWFSVVREVARALTFRKFGGASTIEMQFVRTVTGFRKHTMRRKIYEALLATTTSRRYDKLVILRSYTACAFFGSDLIGADAAAKKIFGKNAQQLGLAEAAFVAAMLARPRPLAGPLSWKVRVRRRAMYGLKVYASGKQWPAILHDAVPDTEVSSGEPNVATPPT